MGYRGERTNGIGTGRVVNKKDNENNTRLINACSYFIPLTKYEECESSSSETAEDDNLGEEHEKIVYFYTRISGVHLEEDGGKL